MRAAARAKGPEQVFEDGVETDQTDAFKRQEFDVDHLRTAHLPSESASGAGDRELSRLLRRYCSDLSVHQP